MGRLLNAFVSVVFFAIPILCYAFLDQFYMKTFRDFGVKWLTRESQHIKDKDQSLSDILKRYQDVVLVSDDLKGFGVVLNDKVLEVFGDASLGQFKTPSQEKVSVNRIGFFKYQTSVTLNQADASTVFFNFQDDTSVNDLVILIFSFVSLLGFALIARARANQLREETVKTTMVRTIQGMAHDFRAPFGKLRVFMSQLEKIDAKSLEKLKVYRKGLDAAVAHADDILTDFLNLDAKTSPAPFNCKAIANRLQSTYFDEWNEKQDKTKLAFSCPDGLWALGIEQKTLRVLFNLLDNALKHAHSKVSLRIFNEGNVVTFEVMNDGAAIPKEHVGAIFKPFFSKRKGGLGLGLFICDTFVRSQNSKLVCESQADATRFYFKLFIAQPTIQKSDNEKAMATSEQTFEIAYVDDELFYQDALKSVLKDSKVRVSVYSDTDSLLLAVRREPSKYELLLVDRFGPNFDAVSDRFAESCRDYGFKGPIVLYSNSVTDQSELSGFSKVVDKVKSIREEDVLRFIRENAID